MSPGRIILVEPLASPILICGTRAPTHANWWLFQLEQNRSPHTVKAYAGVLLDFHRWCATRKVDPLMANAGHLSRYLQDLQQRFRTDWNREMAPSTHNQFVAALQSFFGFLVLKGLRKSLPFAFTSRRMIRQRDFTGKVTQQFMSRNLAFRPVYRNAKFNFPEQKQVVQFIRLIPSHRDKTIALTLWKTGLRVSELCLLSISQICNSGNAGGAMHGSTKQAVKILEEASACNHNILLRIKGKGGKERIVPLPPDIASDISIIIQLRGNSTENSVFLSERKTPLSTAAIQSMFRRRSRAANIYITPHQLRHAFALDWLLAFKTNSAKQSNLAADWEALKTLSLILGHTYASTTEIYWRYLNMYQKNTRQK